MNDAPCCGFHAVGHPGGANLVPLARFRRAAPGDGVVGEALSTGVIPAEAQGCPGNDSTCRVCMPGRSGANRILSGCRDSERTEHALLR